MPNIYIYINFFKIRSYKLKSFIYKTFLEIKKKIFFLPILNIKHEKLDFKTKHLHKKIFSLYIFLYIFFHNICLIVIIKSLY